MALVALFEGAHVGAAVVGVDVVIVALLEAGSETVAAVGCAVITVERIASSTVPPRLHLQAVT